MARSPRVSTLRAARARLYREMRSEARALLGDPPDAIRAYERGWARDFTPARLRQARVAPMRELVSAVRAAQVTLVGDFHPFAQSQRAALRLARASIRKGERWAIGLEMVSSDLQPLLDRWAAGQLSTSRFVRVIRFEKDWGFPWDNYAPLLEWARARAIPLVALGEPGELLRHARDLATGTDRELASRDQWAAGVITDRIAARPELRMIVLFGELHVSRDHLLASLASVSSRAPGRASGRRLRTLLVHQDPEPVHRRAAVRGAELASCLRLGPDAFCLLTATPWTRQQALVHWIEAQADPEAEPDWASSMKLFGTIVARVLGLKAPDFDGVSVVTEPKPESSATDGAWEVESTLLRALDAMGERRWVLPRPRRAPQLAWMPEPTANGAAELAAIHLLRSAGGARARPRPPTTFAAREQHLVEAAFGFFGSLLINPRRRFDLARDHQARLRELRRETSPRAALERDARRLALALLRRARALPLERPAVELLAARHAGRILGAGLYRALVQGRRTPQEIRAAFFSATGPRAIDFLSRELRASRLPRSKLELP